MLQAASNADGALAAGADFHGRKRRRITSSRSAALEATTAADRLPALQGIRNAAAAQRRPHAKTGAPRQRKRLAVNPEQGRADSGA